MKVLGDEVYARRKGIRSFFLHDAIIGADGRRLANHIRQHLRGTTKHITLSKYSAAPTKRQNDPERKIYETTLSVNLFPLSFQRNHDLEYQY